MADSADFVPDIRFEYVALVAGHLPVFIGTETTGQQVVGHRHLAPRPFEVVQARKYSSKSHTENVASVINDVDGNWIIKTDIAAKPAQAACVG